MAFGKFYIFDNHGRPVFYEETDKAKQLLPEQEHWRIVNLQLYPRNPKIVDWTHEREWRLPGDFEFRYDYTHVVLYDKACWDYFHKNCPPEIIKSIHGITIIKSILM